MRCDTSARARTSTGCPTRLKIVLRAAWQGETAIVSKHTALCDLLGSKSVSARVGNMDVDESLPPPPPPARLRGGHRGREALKMEDSSDEEAAMELEAARAACRQNRRRR
jgi:hypothetical protein